jgi:acyl carrier protein
MESIEETLRTYIAQNLLYSSNGFPYSDQASFLENGIVDSMNVMEIVMFVEGKYDLKIQDSEILPDNFDSVSRLADFIRRKQS